ncbi:glycosyl hydrolase [Mangrovibacterium sp.]|uniref:glycosyl hydrolase n=1 Tax=Mangrovibacterium sp. TaxID=1961364 RepID=UPI00356A7D9E
MKRPILGIIIYLLSLSATYAQVKDTASLGYNFKNPPHSAKPLTWMHVMSGNMSKEGMTKDLEAIADAGIGGIILFNVTHNIPNGPVKFNSPEDIALKAHTAAECERLGLSFGIHNCDGWTSSGGPWVPVEHSMKQVVHRHVVIDGGEVDMFLPGPSKCGNYYEDIAVLAYPALPSEIEDTESQPIITASKPDFDVNIATNGKIDERAELTVANGEKAWVQWDFGKPFTVRSFFLKSENQRTKNANFTLEYSEDGETFTEVKTLKINRLGKYFYTIDESFEGITARYFRFVTNFALDIAEVNLSSLYRFDNMISRTSIHRSNNGGLPALKEQAPDNVISGKDIINLTAKVNDKGVLKTTLPEGKWTIMRVGYTTTSAINDPASIEGTGLEVDKFSRESFNLFYDGYVRNVIDASKKVAPKALQYVEIDSYEVGSQNWTQGYEKQFNEQFDYDIIKFLPLYAGRFIDDAETTERVLWDIRNFNSQLMCDNYFDYFTELCHNDGLISYVEPYGNAAFNTLDAARKADIPMGEFHSSGKSMVDVAVSAGHIYGRNIISAEAFTSGTNMHYEVHPGMLKTVGDQGWVNGINEIVFHRFTHQPNTKVKPGMTMSGFGSHIDRTQTWWESAGKSWFKYLARGQYLLRQGYPAADILAFVGDGSPNTVASRNALRNLPNYINYDCVNADVLSNRITVKDGKMILPEGGSYHALYLNNVRQMHLSTLKRLDELSDQGVIILGGKPDEIGGYSVTEADKAEFNKLVSKIWSHPTTRINVNWEAVYHDFKLPVDLKIAGREDINYIHRKTENEDIYFFFNPDGEQRTFECTFNVTDKIPELWNPMDGTITRLSAFEQVGNTTKVVVTLPAEGSAFIVFQQSAKGVKSVRPADAISNSKFRVKLNDEGKTVLEATANGNYKLNFSDGTTAQISVDDIPEPLAIDGEWQVYFPDLKKGAQTFTFPKLIDWTSHDFEGVKYYSGTATYSKTIKISKQLLGSDRKLILDLGEVNVVARVILNGKDLGVIWTNPYVVDVTSALKVGINELQIELTNQWSNRLIGDENFPNVSGYDLRPQINKPQEAKDPHLTLINQYNMVDWFLNNEPAPLGQRSTFTTYPFYKKGDRLLPAGLVGPVNVSTQKLIVIE